MSKLDRTRQVVLLLHDGFPAAALGHLHDSFSVANWLTGRPLYRLTAAASDAARQVRSYGGFAVPTEPIQALDPASIAHLFLLVSFDPQSAAYSDAVVRLIRGAHRRGVTLCGVETGAAVMAKAGLLQGGAAAVHWANRDGFAEAFPDVALSDAPVAVNQRCLTCVGGVFAADLALILIERDHGRPLAQQVAEHLHRGDALALSRAESAAHPAARRSQPLQRALAVMQRHLEEPLPCGEVARRAGLSLRQMERLFRRELGTTPIAHYRALRLTRAQNLLQQTNLGIAEIAASSGFASFAHFTRVYKAQFGVAPSSDRRQDLQASVPRVFLDPARLAGGG